MAESEEELKSLLMKVKEESEKVVLIHWKDWSWSWSSSSLATWCKEPPHGKRPFAGKDWVQEEKRSTENEMAGWHHGLSGHEFEQTPGDGEGQGSLVCCSSWGHKEPDTHDLATELQQSLVELDGI